MSTFVSNTVTIDVTALVPTSAQISVSSSSIIDGQTDTITGTVYDQENNPMSGVTVYLWWSAYQTGYKWSYAGMSATSDSSGNFSFTITSSKYDVGKNEYAVTGSAIYGPS